MSSIQVVTIYGICLAAAVYLAASAGLRLRAVKSSPDFIMLCCCLAEWLVCNSLFFLVPDESLAYSLNEIKFIGIAFASVFLFRFTAKFMSLKRLQSGNLLIVLCVVPFITSVIALSNPIHGLFRASVQIVTDPYRAVVVENGPWYIVHTLYSYGLIVASAILVLVGIRKTAPIYRMPQYVVLVGMLLTMAVNIAVIFNPARPQLDITPVSMSAALLFLYWAMGNSRTSDYLNVAKEEVYNTLPACIFVLDMERVVVDVNRAARALCAAAELRSPAGMPYDALIEEAMRRVGGGFVDGRWDSERDIQLEPGGERRIYSIAETVLEDRNGRKIGSYVTMTDDTQARVLIERLEYNAGIDALTGLGNRHMYEGKLADMDQPALLPLSILLGDVNNLEIINARYGFAEGDSLLAALGKILLEIMPPDGFAARVGSDKFALILPNTDEYGSRRIVEEIRRRAALHKGTRSRPSIALGFATKYYAGEDIAALIRDAEGVMFADKRGKRREEPAVSPFAPRGVQ